LSNTRIRESAKKIPSFQRRLQSILIMRWKVKMDSSLRWNDGSFYFLVELDCLPR